METAPTSFGISHSQDGSGPPRQEIRRSRGPAWRNSNWMLRLSAAPKNNSNSPKIGCMAAPLGVIQFVSEKLQENAEAAETESQDISSEPQNVALKIIEPIIIIFVIPLFFSICCSMIIN